MTSEAEIIGVYELTTQAGNIKLNLQRGHTFREVITFANGKAVETTGTWRWNGAVSVDELWIPAAFAPDYIIQADKLTGPKVPKYSEPHQASLGAESHFGRIVISIYPDSDIEFRKMASP